MKNSEFVRQCIGLKVGMKFQAAPDSENPNQTFEIIETGLVDGDGFPAVKLLFADGETAISAKECIYDAIDSGCKII